MLDIIPELKASGQVYDSTKTLAVTAGNLFNIYGTEKAEVRLVTLPEINKFIGREDVDSTTTMDDNDDLRGIFKLDELSEVTGTREFVYSKGTYWLASPDGKNDILGKGVATLKYSGEFSGDFSNTNGIRPVICITGNVKLYDENVDGVLEIKLQ